MVAQCGIVHRLFWSPKPLVVAICTAKSRIPGESIYHEQTISALSDFSRIRDPARERGLPGRIANPLCIGCVSKLGQAL
jgi:hypothetical protein